MNTGAMLSIVISLVFAGLIFYAFIWFLRWVAIPEPFNKIIMVVIGLFVLIYIIGVLTGSAPPMLGHVFQSR